MDSQDPKWRKQFDELLMGMTERRKQHPKATFAEIEQEMLKRTAALQARLMEELAQTSPAADWEAGEAPICRECGTQMQKRGQPERHLQGPGGQDIRLERAYAVCPQYGAEIFPPGRRVSPAAGKLEPAYPRLPSALSLYWLLFFICMEGPIKCRL